MTNTNATYATSIAVDLPDYPAATVTFTNTAFFVSGNSEVLPGKQYTLTLNSTGQGTQTLPCPDNTGDAAVNWRINLPSKESGTYAIAYDAATQQLSDILAAQSTTADPDAITAAIAGKMDKVAGGIQGHAVEFASGGQVTDAGFVLGTAAAADVGDFDAAGAAATAQAAAIAASLQKTSNLSDVANVTAARENLDIKIDPALTIRVIGDSIAAGASVSALQAALKNVAVSTLAIGGETSAQILARVEAVSVIRPARGATLSGATDVVIAENVPPRMVDTTYAASWAGYQANAMIDIDTVLIRNQHKMLGAAQRRRYFAKCVYATDNNLLTLWREMSPIRNVVYGGTFENLVTGSDITATNSFVVSRFTGAVSTDYAKTGSKSAKLTNTAVGASEVRFRDGDANANLVATKIYEVDYWVYIPIAFTVGAGNWEPTAAYDDLIWLDGTGAINTVTPPAGWTRQHFLIRISSGQINIRVGMGVNSAGDVGKSVYIDNVIVKEKYQDSNDTPTAADTVYVTAITSGGMPSALAEYRRYYIVNPASDVLELALTSGGAPIDLASNGYAIIHENYHLAWTPAAPDTTMHYLNAQACSGDYGAFALIWAGLNDTGGWEEIAANVEEMVARWTANGRHNRFAVMTLVNRFESGDSATHERWRTFNEWALARWPDNAVDAYGAAIAWGLAQATSSQDYIDALNGRVPASLLGDGVHPNDAGNAIMFTAPVTAHLIARGYCVAA